MADIIVTKESHPSLFEVLETISHDRGAGAGHGNYAIPDTYEKGLDLYEAALKGLTDKEYEAFAIGETDEATAIAERTPELRITHNFLTAFFNDFEEDVAL